MNFIIVGIFIYLIVVYNKIATTRLSLSEPKSLLCELFNLVPMLCSYLGIIFSAFLIKWYFVLLLFVGISIFIAGPTIRFIMIKDWLVFFIRINRAMGACVILYTIFIGFIAFD